MLWSCCRQVDLKPWQCSPHDMFNVRILVWGFVCGFVWCAWLSGRQSKTNRIPQKKKKEKKKKLNTTAVEVESEVQMRCCNSVGSLLSVLLWCVVSHFKNMNGVTFFFFKWWVHVMYNQIYYIYGMFYRRQNMKSAKHTAQKHRLWKCCCIFRLTFYQCKYHLYIFFCIFFVRCFLNSTLIKKKKKKPPWS